VIGFLSGYPAESFAPETQPYAAAFRQGLSETGYSDGHNVTMNTDGRRTNRAAAWPLVACERTAQGLQAECRGRRRVQKNFAERVAEIRAQLAP